MNRIKKNVMMCAIFALIGLGGVLLMIDYQSLLTAWFGLIGAFVCIIGGIVLGYVLNHKEMLPE